MPETEPRRGWGDLTQAVLDLVADAGRPMTPTEVREALGERLAYTTVTTVLVRLHDRGLLTRRRAGRAYAYAAVGDPAQITARRMHRLLDVDDDRAGVLTRFVGGLRPGDERLLRDLLHEATLGGLSSVVARPPTDARPPADALPSGDAVPRGDAQSPAGALSAEPVDGPRPGRAGGR